MPFVTFHYPEFWKLGFEWEWRVVEGVAAPVHCTSWVKPMVPRLSRDGTTELLESLSDFDSRVIHFRKTLWPGKVAMFNEALKTIDEPCLLIEVDSDELWTAEQITKLRQMFIEHPEKNCARFRCRYFVGRDIVITNTDGAHYGNHEAYEWKRAWKITSGSQFERHEPPVIRGLSEVPFTQAETQMAGLVFDHYAYATESQVAFKANYYGSENNQAGAKYKDAVLNWKRLQENRKWPVLNLEEFMPWIGPGVTADKI